MSEHTMKRRSFLINSLGVTTGLVSYGPTFAARPCPLEFTGVTNEPCQISENNLSEAASALGAGQSVAFTNLPSIGQFGISWQNRTAFWDEFNGEFQFMAKAQSGGNASHHIYNEATDTWRRTSGDVSPGQAGHVWCVTFDHSSGDYYYLDFDPSNFIRYYDRTTDSWTQTSTAGFDIQEGSSKPSTGIAYHPNLYGINDPGVLVYGVTELSAWRKNTNTWELLQHYGSSASPYFNRRSAPSLYIPGHDRIIIGSGVSNPDTLCLVLDAGSGGALATTAPALEAAPVRILGTASVGTSGMMMLDPRDRSTIMLLERGGNRVWTNSAGGIASGWVSETYTHPFWSSLAVNSGDYGSWTCGSISSYGVVWGMATHGSGTQSVLWKPGN